MRLTNRLRNAVRQSPGGRSVDRVERRLRELAEATDDVLWVFAGDWSEAIFVNPAYEEVWGRSIDALEARPDEFLDGVHPEDREDVRRAMDRLSNGHPVEVEHRVNEAENYRRWVWSRGEPITDEDGAVVRIAGLSRETTERKLRRRNERQEEFARMVSHDLRNPLNVARGRLALAREECDSDHLLAVERAHERMETLIEDLLTQAEEDERVSDVEPVELAETVEECWRNVETGAATLSIGTERTIRADRSRLKQLLENLIRNAVEHGGRDAVVMLGDRPGGFYVEDDGPGIPEDERKHVFQPGHSTSHEGTGLGLHIVKQVVDAHGWRIRVSEGAFGGARFDVTGVDVES